MGKIIDFKSKKIVDSTEQKTSYAESPSYLDRVKLCAERAKYTLNQKCDCVYCVHKEALAIKLATISQWLVTDHCEKNDLDLCWADWFDITVTSASKVKDIVYPNLKKS